MRIGDKALLTCGISGFYCPTCGHDCSGTLVSLRSDGADVLCPTCGNESAPDELTEERTEGQQALWLLIEQMQQALTAAAR